MKYPIIIQKDPNSDYGVIVPDLPGCFSSGETIEEAMHQAEEAILTHIEGLLMDNENIPQPSAVEVIKKKKEFQKDTFAIVSVDISKLSGKAKRVNITVPERLLHKFDSYAENEGETRSGFLVQAALDYIKKRD